MTRSGCPPTSTPHCRTTCSTCSSADPLELLLDTHAFLWWVADDRRLSETARTAIAEPGTTVFVSAASGWEIAIKAALGRLRLAAPPAQFVPEHVRLNAFRPLAISLAHALAVHGLPDHHRDPFDRILAAQARAEGLTMVSVDPLLRAYDVEIVW